VATSTLDRSAVTQLRADEVDAWFEYLESTRRQDQFRYDDVEPWAWARLERRLRAIAARRKALR
jgi:hypothetical protein